MPAICWSCDDSDPAAVLYVRSNVPGAVTTARKSPNVRPSGGLMSVYASTLLPLVSVNPAGIHGSGRVVPGGWFRPSIDSRFGSTYGGYGVVFGVPVALGVMSAIGPSNGWSSPV